MTTFPPACPVAESNVIVPCLSADVPLKVCRNAPSVNPTVDCVGSRLSERPSARAGAGRAIAKKQSVERTTSARFRDGMIINKEAAILRSLRRSGDALHLREAPDTALRVLQIALRCVRMLIAVIRVERATRIRQLLRSVGANDHAPRRGHRSRRRGECRPIRCADIVTLWRFRRGESAG